jgi:hypothetical protein
MLTCKICSKTFDNIPFDAVPASQMRRGYQLWRFKNGELHDIKEMKPLLEPKVARPSHVPVAEPFMESVDAMVSKLQKRWLTKPIKKYTAPDAEENKL